MGENELSFCELRAKEVVNATDGKRMGRIVDLIFSRDDGTVSGIVVPFSKRSFFGKNQDVFIPWRCVQKIGEDVILVTLSTDAEGNLTCGHKPPPPKPSHPHKDCGHGCRDTYKGNQPCESDSPPHPDCDCRCEKCMLFDCAYRWAQN